MRASPPLRFLAMVLVGWAALRTALIAPPWSTPPAGAAAKAPPRPARWARDVPPVIRTGTGATEGPAGDADAIPGWVESPSSRGQRPAPAPPAQVSASGKSVLSALPPAATVPAALPPIALHPIALHPGLGQRGASAGRWSLSAWTFVRRGDPAPLAAAGLLGGSQAGARLTYRLNRGSGRPLALSARLSGPLRRSAGAEAALGVDWKPARRLPVHLLAERRQALGREGRSAFAVTLYGGVSDARLGSLRIDGYGQAGMVGARSRDPFADGSLRLSLPVSERVRLGAGAWGAAQPGLARLDLGPQAALRLPLAGRAVTLAADWRFRIAGNAEPGSGPTLTLSSDF